MIETLPKKQTINVPVAFHLFSTPVHVTFEEEIHTPSGEEALGFSNAQQASIVLSEKIKQYKSLLTDTFYHERTHMILDSMGRADLSADEPFVETFSRLLKQADETAIYI